MKINKYTTLLITIVAILFLQCGCSSSGDNTPYSKSGLYYDTVISVTIYGTGQSEAKRILNECMTLCDHYEKLFDPDINTSDIAKINSSDQKPIHVDNDTIKCIREALKYSEISNGKFDITIKPVSDLWDFHENPGVIPAKEQLTKASVLVDYKKITIDPVNSTVSLPSGYSIELGAAAKGFIAGKIKEYLIKQSITGAIINIGGDICLLGSKPDGSDYNIGINDPFSDGKTAMTLVLQNTSVATSGTYERFFTSAGKKYHHILDSKTGYPVETDVLSVTVITNNPVDCDCLCTLCVIEGAENALEMINSIPDTEAIIICNDGVTLTSSGAARYIKP